jgi:hypothetical protein
LIALVGSGRIGALLRKEKDGISPPKLFFGGFVEFTSIPRLRSLEVFLFSKIFRPRAGLSIVKNVRVKNYFSRAQN